ncbi:hypothetical protein CT0861_06791 [Colletotrichum tofieldiae]|uniref:BTB domain-containing protein n=1 Tax=Colletotrichum tofieldiae TaxID=708197 RepID=A0A166U7Z1_9PEZI|nr:hypothetical protein CT0861_06791 [Colletotrichum tofieldiae]
METNSLWPTPSPEMPEDLEPEVTPNVSPYSSPSCKVYFRSGRLFRVPRDLLCEALESIRRSSHEIRLSHIPDEAGHVLIHYLHTGRWQAIVDKESLDTTGNSTLLEISLHVYAAARTYKLPRLTAFAEARISRYAVALPALEILILASNACQLLGEDDLWFSGFIKLRVRQLFEDPTSLDKTAFLSCFDSATPYSKMLVKYMVDICCEKSTFVYPESLPTPQAEPDTTVRPEATPLLIAAEPESEPPKELAPNDEPAPNDVGELFRKDKKKKKGKKMYQFPPEPEAVPLMDTAEPWPEAVAEVEPAQSTESEPVEVEITYKDWFPSVKVSKNKTKK